MLNISIVASVTLIYQQRLFFPLNGKSNTQQRLGIKTNCSGEADGKSEREALIFFVTISFMKENLPNPSQGCSLWAFMSVTTLSSNIEDLA